MSYRKLLAALCLCAWPALLPAQAPPSGQANTATVEAGAAAGLHGRAAFNLAAGHGNAQANLAAIAHAPDAPGIALLDARQQVTAAAEAAGPTQAVIADGAFAGSHGALAVNQVAGSGNAQLNLLALGQHAAGAGSITVANLGDAALAAVAGDPMTEGTAIPPPLHDARIEPGAFAGSQGVVQVNQTAGVGNASVNAIVLRIPGGTP